MKKKRFIDKLNQRAQPIETSMGMNMNGTHNYVWLLPMAICLASCSQAANNPASASSDGNQTAVSQIETQGVKESIVNQLSSHFKMSSDDLESSSIQIQRVPSASRGEPARYHATGDFILSWTQPRNAYEAADAIVQQNICAVAPPNECKHGFRHTIYLDVVATADSSGQQYDLKGDVTIDRTIAEQKQQDAAQAADSARQAKEEALAQQKQAEQDQLKKAQQQAEIEADEAKARQKKAIDDFQDHQQFELRSALTALVARQQQERNDLNSQLAQTKSQLQSTLTQQASARSGGYTIQMERQEQQSTAPLYSQIADIQRRQGAMYQQNNMQRQQLISQMQARQADDLQRFKAQLASGEEQQQVVPANSTVAASPASPQGASDAQSGYVPEGEAVAHGPSFNCSKASTTTEHAICDSPELSRLDSEVGTLYHRVMSSATPEMQQAVKADQRQWIISRQRQCQADVQCISNSLQSRVATLQARLQ